MKVTACAVAAVIAVSASQAIAWGAGMSSPPNQQFAVSTTVNQAGTVATITPSYQSLGAAGAVATVASRPKPAIVAPAPTLAAPRPGAATVAPRSSSVAVRAMPSSFSEVPTEAGPPGGMMEGPPMPVPQPAQGDLWTDCGPSCCCSKDCWWHHTGAFGEVLFLQARGVDMAYAVPQDGVDLFTSVPIGAVGTADPDYETGFRVGYNYALDRCSSVVATYAWYESDTNDSIATNAPNVIRSLVHHPGTVTALEGFGLFADAHYDIDFNVADVQYRRLYCAGKHYAVNYSLGVRGAELDQEFLMNLSATTTSTVTTDIEFEGYGLSVGIDGQRRAPCSGLFAYGRAQASALAGQFSSTYRLENNAPALLASIAWDDDRVVPILEYELGIGWENACGTLRFSAGYYLAAWTNVVTTNEWIQAVQANDFVDLGDTVTFDGLTGRVEIRW